VLTKSDATLLSQEEYFPYGRASETEHITGQRAGPGGAFRCWDGQILLQAASERAG